MRKSSRNPQLEKQIKDMRGKAHQEGARVWKDLSERLSKSSSRRAEVNIGRIARSTSDSDVVAVPGKVLGSGVLPHKVTVGAYSFSRRAREKIINSGGECLSLGELSEREPSGRGVKIME